MPGATAHAHYECYCVPTEGSMLRTPCCDTCDVAQIGKSMACYMGQFVRGVREGLGIITAADGARYEGSFKDNLMWGPGAGCYGDVVAILEQWLGRICMPPSTSAQVDRPSCWEAKPPEQSRAEQCHAL